VHPAEGAEKAIREKKKNKASGRRRSGKTQKKKKVKFENFTD